MDKGQHLRLMLKKSSSMVVVALATDFTFHCSATTENSTTKDSTDVNGLWEEFEITAKNYDISITALIGVGEDSGILLGDIMDDMNDTPVDWELATFSGANNRTKVTSIATGKAKVTNINPVGQNRQKAQYTANLSGYGPITVAQ